MQLYIQMYTYRGLFRIGRGNILINITLGISILSADAEYLEADQGYKEGAKYSLLFLLRFSPGLSSLDSDRFRLHLANSHTKFSTATSHDNTQSQTNPILLQRSENAICLSLLLHKKSCKYYIEMKIKCHSCSQIKHRS